MIVHYIYRERHVIDEFHILSFTKMHSVVTTQRVRQAGGTTVGGAGCLLKNVYVHVVMYKLRSTSSNSVRLRNTSGNYTSFLQRQNYFQNDYCQKLYAK